MNVTFVHGGAPGVDGMTVDELMPWCRAHWARIREELLSGTYRPVPARKVEIPKPGGKGMRMLGIPTVLDRMIQQALLQVLTPIFDPPFSQDSYGFRPGRSAQDGVARAREHIATGEGQAGAPSDPPVSAGGDDGGWRGVAPCGRDAARRSPLTAPEQHPAR